MKSLSKLLEEKNTQTSLCLPLVSHSCFLFGINNILTRQSFSIIKGDICLHLLVCLNYHNKLLQAGWLKHQTFIYHEAEKSKVKVSAGSGSGESSLPGFETTTFLLCPHLAFPLFFHRQEQGGKLSSLSSYMDINPSLFGSGSHPHDLILTGPYLHIQSRQGFGLQHMNWRGRGRTQSSPQQSSKIFSQQCFINFSVELLHIQLLNLSLRIKICFCILNLCPATRYQFQQCFVDSLGIPVYTIMTSVHKDTFTFSFPKFIFYFFLPYCICYDLYYNG